VAVSSLRGDGIEKLKDEIEAIVWSGRVGSTDVDVAINERQADAIRRSLRSLTFAESTMAAKSNAEIISQELRIGLDAIGEIVGKTATDDILAKIFSTFCIGK
jgi:tRNA modification GTPase